jgi:hypothetical protein
MAPSAGPPSANLTVQVLSAVIGAVATTIITSNLDASPTANLLGAAVGAAIGPLATYVGPNRHLRLGGALAAIAIGLFLTYGGFTIFDAAADKKTFPGPIDGSSLLEAGDTGPEVEELERLLAARGFDPGAIDGRFDRDTEQAVKDFQGSEGMAADGIVGGQTWTALREGP